MRHNIRWYEQTTGTVPLLIAVLARRTPRRLSISDVMTLFRVSLLAVMIWSTAACAPWHKRETDYPGGGIGIIETRASSDGGGFAEYVQNVTIVPVGKAVVLLPPREIATPTPGKFHYQIRAKDGTLHLLANDAAFDIGTCVTFSGYADGPSRTHWSFGRTTLVRSADCGK